MVFRPALSMATRFLIALLIMLPGLPAIGPEPVFAQEAPPAAARRHSLMHRVGDTLLANLKAHVEPKPLGWKAWVIPIGLVSYGTISTATEWLDDVNLLGKRWATDNEDPDHKTHIDDYTQSLPAIAVLGLHIGGVRGRNNLVDASLMYGMSLGIANSIVMPVKRWTAERRPDSSDVLSFPSGHTATAFVSAEFLRQEYKGVSPWIGAGGYAVAVLTGYLRMYNNKHWLSDVAAGAGIGILSTRVTYWLYPKLKNAITGSKAGGTTMIVPMYQSGGYGLCLVHRF
jgi:membrane-associated phospholipid phosphatase